MFIGKWYGFVLRDSSIPRTLLDGIRSLIGLRMQGVEFDAFVRSALSVSAINPPRFHLIFRLVTELSILLESIGFPNFWQMVIDREPAFMENIQIKDLVEYIARCLVEHPEQVVVKEITGHQISIIELRAAKDDLGKIIGKEGRNADAMRTIVNATAMKLKKRVVLEILE